MKKITCPTCKHTITELDLDHFVYHRYSKNHPKPINPDACGFTPPIDITCP